MTASIVFILQLLKPSESNGKNNSEIHQLGKCVFQGYRVVPQTVYIYIYIYIYERADYCKCPKSALYGFA